MGGVGAFDPSAFAVGAFVCAAAFFSALGAGFSFCGFLVAFEPLASAGTSSAWWWVGVVLVFGASRFGCGAVYPCCFFFGGVAGGEFV